MTQYKHDAEAKAVTKLTQAVNEARKRFNRPDPEAENEAAKHVAVDFIRAIGCEYLAEELEKVIYKNA